MEEKLRIKLHLYETDLMVNVPREEEQYYRAAAKQVTETVNTYAKIYQGKKTHNDVMYMAMLDLWRCAPTSSPRSTTRSPSWS